MSHYQLASRPAVSKATRDSNPTVATTMNIGDGESNVSAGPGNPRPSALAPQAVLPFESSGHKVTHHYHDHSNDPDGDYDVQQIVQKTGGPGVEQSFPMKLHYMLNDIEEDNLSHIVSWMAHGRCFVVHNQKLFVEKILGCWFRQSKIASFQRQLNIYGFQRLTTGPDKNGYYHELFLRGKPGLASRIQRQKLKGTKTRRAASPESEPNFYAMNPMAPTAKAPQVKPTVPLTSSILQSTLDKSGASASSLTLQKIAPSLFSPAAFETTVHLVPQSGQRQPRPQGLMVTSTCSLTLKPSDDIRGGSAFSVTQFPFTTTTYTFQGTNPPRVASPSTARSSEAFWTALGGSAMPLTLRDATSGIPVAAAPSSLWLSR